MVSVFRRWSTRDARWFDKATGVTRPAQYGDVAILFQSLNNVALYEDALAELSIPYVTTAGRGYYDRQEVWDVLNLLQAVHNSADNLALASALRSPLFGLSDDTLFALRLSQREAGGHGLLWDALATGSDLTPADERDKVAFARDCLYELRTLAGRTPIAELLRRALSLTGYLATLTGLPDGRRRRGNINKLIEKAQASATISLGAFSQYLRDLSAREAREGDAAVDTHDAVSLMSVHASKGLEFPVVCVVDASWRRRGGQQALALVDDRLGVACKAFDDSAGSFYAPFGYRRIAELQSQKEEAERLRILYVAATRAQDLLIVSGQAAPTADGRWRSYGWLEILMGGVKT